jgi:hypothetical protein
MKNMLKMWIKKPAITMPAFDLRKSEERMGRGVDYHEYTACDDYYSQHQQNY